MKAKEMIETIKMSASDRWISFFEASFRMQISVWKDSDGLFTVRYGAVRIEEADSITPYGPHGDYVEIKYKGVQLAILECFDLQPIRYPEADSREYEKSEKDAMWERD